ncbi:hypothetical protein M2103_000975 [Ereboglobus sp. PH5-5]|uniref:hypothetical protein n=1 Tax=Ereboglobus sp. PH5-10 TaxID=2940629 RepID=UPI002405AF6F|nr:hypothetical protein [Ereboglobus sp. PH5-10]MDF9826571.1 hypothetical protein [Ereboglobus sp. PH5-10]MDF9832761.1 hypothetical protein [Ereboglobus sp. PH5-5]
MESHDIVKELLKRVPAKHVAQELGVSLSLVYKWAEAPIVGSGTSNPLDRIEVLTRLAGDMAPLEWLCSRFEGTFVKRPTEEITTEDFLYRISRIIIELGHVLGEFSESDGSIELVSASKAQDVRLRWEKAKATIESFLIAAEQGQFSKTARATGDGGAAKQKITPTRYKRSLGLNPERPRVPLNTTVKKPM